MPAPTALREAGVPRTAGLGGLPRVVARRNRGAHGPAAWVHRGPTKSVFWSESAVLESGVLGVTRWSTVP